MTNVPAPIPNSSLPISWTTWIATASGIITFGLLPAIHQTFPIIPALDLTTVQGALGVLVSLGILAHNQGLKAIADYVVKNIWPGLQAQLLPELEAIVAKAVAQQLEHGSDVGALSKDDVTAVLKARVARNLTDKV